MTNSDTPRDPRAIAIESLADTMLRDESDFVDLLDALRPLLDAADFDALAAHLDICAIHRCDIEICIDNDPDWNEH